MIESDRVSTSMDSLPVEWIVPIPSVYPPPSNSHKGRFIGIPYDSLLKMEESWWWLASCIGGNRSNRSNRVTFYNRGRHFCHIFMASRRHTRNSALFEKNGDQVKTRIVQSFGAFSPQYKIFGQNPGRLGSRICWSRISGNFVGGNLPVPSGKVTKKEFGPKEIGPRFFCPSTTCCVGLLGKKNMVCSRNPRTCNLPSRHCPSSVVVYAAT